MTSRLSYLGSPPAKTLGFSGLHEIPSAPRISPPVSHTVQQVTLNPVLPSPDLPSSIVQWVHFHDLPLQKRTHRTANVSTCPTVQQVTLNPVLPSPDSPLPCLPALQWVTFTVFLYRKESIEPRMSPPVSPTVQQVTLNSVLPSPDSLLTGLPISCNGSLSQSSPTEKNPLCPTLTPLPSSLRSI